MWAALPKYPAKGLMRLAMCAGLFLSALSSFSSPSFAVCSSPAGVEGEITYNEDYRVPQYCDGTDNWIAMVGAGPNTTDVVSGLTAYWKFDDAAASTTAAEEINANDATEVGSISFNTTGGQINGSLVGTNVAGDYMLLPNDAAVRPTTFPITVSVWFKPSDPTPQAQDWLQTEDWCNRGAVRSGIEFGYSGAALYLRYGDATGCGTSDWNGIFQSADFSQVRWYHVVGIIRGKDDMSLYVDGVDIGGSYGGTTSATSAVYTGSLQGIIGGPNSGLALDGELDDLRMYNRELTVSEIQNMYQFGGGVLASTTTEIVPSGLVGHWRLDETSGATIADSSGNGNDGTWTDNENNDITEEATDGLVGGALGFEPDATGEGNDHVLIGTPAVLNNLGPMSVCTWAKTIGGTFGANSPMVAKGTGGQTGWQLYFNRAGGDRAGFRTTEQAYKNSGIQMARDTWEHVCATWDGTDGTSGIIIYLNGQDAGTQSSADVGATLDDSTYDLYIGRNSGSSTKWEGWMDDVRIYNRVLSAAEVQEIYMVADGIHYNEAERVPEYFDGNRFVAMPPAFSDVTTNLVGHWKLDETSGLSAADSAGTNTGTLTNFPANANGNWVAGNVNNALDFDSLTEVVNLGSAASLDDLSLNSISVWVYPRTMGETSKGRILNKALNSTNPPNNGWSLSLVNDVARAVKFSIHHNSSHTEYASVANVITLNTWNHIVTTWDGTTNANNVHIYVNGTEVGYSYIDTGAGARVSDAANNLLIGNSTAGDRTFDGYIDDVRLYDTVLSSGDVQTLYQRTIPPVGSVTALPQGCATIGNVCDDGTVYAGVSPDGSVAMFTTQQDAGSLEWNDGNANYTTTGATSTTAGAANTNTIVTTDANSVTGGFQTHNAAQYCYDLVANGADDWYLPAQGELNILYTNLAAIGNFELAAGEYGTPPSWYWSSTEDGSAPDAFLQRFEDGTQAGWNKFYAKAVRCVRKGPAPRCASPYGVEGAMLYNNDNDVVQYCDGARWIGIGKRN